MNEEEFNEAFQLARAKIAEAVQEYLNLKMEHSLICEASDHFGMAPHTHLLSDAVVCYQSICLGLENGKPGYLIDYFSITQGTIAADYGVVCAAQISMRG